MSESMIDHGSFLVGIVGLLLTVSGLLVSAVWIVAQIRATTDKLSEAIKELRETLEKMGERHDTLDGRVRDVEQRLAALGGRAALTCDPQGRGE